MSRKDKEDSLQPNVSYSKSRTGESNVKMNGKSMHCSKTLDSIASLQAKNYDSASDFKRSGVLLMAKSDAEGGNGDLLIPGILSLSLKTPWKVPCIEWTPEQPENDESGAAYGTSFSEWTLVNEQLSKRNVRPIDFELCELKSFRLSDDGNKMVLIQRDGTRHPPLIFLDEGPEELITVMKRHFCVRQSASDEYLYLLTDARVEALDRSLSQLNLFDKKNTDAVWKFVNDMHADPYSTALSAFSKIADKLIFSPNENDEMRPVDNDEMAQLIHKSLLPNNLEVTTGNQDDGAFEVVTSRPRLSDKLPSVPRSEPLCQLDWELHWDTEGNVQDKDELIRKIFKGGLEQNVRSEAWKFLLSYYDFDLDHKGRELHRKSKVDSYFRMKLQWRSISADQEDRFSAFRERKTQIEKDVSRTDRTHPYFAGDDNKNIDLLQDILMTYVMYNFDLGYVQGMSDLLAPILFVVQNEVDAFWCFAGFMSKVSKNFDFDQGGMKNQLSQLIELLKTYDPEFYSYLDAKDSGNLYFCFRWLLIWFKREFPFTDVMRMWEVLWTNLPCPNFHLIVCLALMDLEKKTIVENGFGFTEILKHINDMANSNISVTSVLSRAEAIYLKLSKSHYVSNSARRILDLPLVTEQDLAIQAKALQQQQMQGSPSSSSNSATNGISPIRSRRRHQNSGNSESSVEVLTELDEDAKFENGFADAVANY